MSELKAYLYAKCDTCRKAKKFLAANGIAYQEIPIREEPPSVAELERMLAAYNGEVRRLFNTSGQEYRQGGYKDKLGTMTIDQALLALSENGNLIKRPFVISDQIALVGFKADDWEKQFLQ